MLTDILEIIMLAVALAMDCFTVSIASGVVMRRWYTAPILRIALLFGLFQAAMPLAGWAATVHFSSYIEAYDHWVAFLLLLFLGGRMIVGALRSDDSLERQSSFNPMLLRTQLLLAVATSIDALAVGIAFTATGHLSLLSLALPLTVIGIVSFLFSLLGHHLGISFGKTVSRRIKPELLGGIILVAIGTRVLISHLLQH